MRRMGKLVPDSGESQGMSARGGVAGGRVTACVLSVRFTPGHSSCVGCQAKGGWPRDFWVILMLSGERDLAGLERGKSEALASENLKRHPNSIIKINNMLME